MIRVSLTELHFRSLFKLSSNCIDMRLSDRYRPQRFEDILGQPDAVRQLSELILRGRVAGRVLLHGAYGSGKTSIVPIYGRALNCPDLAESGSPCNSCDSCLRSADYIHTYDVPSRPDRDSILTWAEAHSRDASKGKIKTLFLDEAHAMEPAAMDGLLSVSEREMPHVAICLATTNPRKLLKPLTSRFLDIAFGPLRLGDALALLEGVAQKEGMTYDRDAFILLAKLKRGHPRDLLNGLEQVYLYERRKRIRVESVEEVFDVDQGAYLIDYLIGVFQRSTVRYSETKIRWRATAREKVQLLRAVLTSIYYRDVQHFDISVSPLADAITRGRAELLIAFEALIGEPANDKVRYCFARLLNFWLIAPMDVDEASYQLQLANFEEFVRSLSDESQAPAVGEGVRRPPVQQQKYELEQSTRPDRRRVVRYLQVSDVANIVNRSSYLIQHYGIMFNAFAMVSAGSRIRRSEEKSVASFEDILFNLDSVPTKQSDELAFVAVPEAENGEFTCRIALHLPVGDALSRKAVQDVERISKDRCEIVWEFTDRLTVDRDHVKFHWGCVRKLCAGVADPGNGNSSDEDLRKNLKIPKTLWRVPSLMDRPQPLFSSLLSDRALQEACRLKMEFLSAFDDRAWASLFSGWELFEFEGRRHEIEVRQRALQEVESAFANDPSKMDLAKEELIKEWRDAKSRPRRWEKGKWF